MKLETMLCAEMKGQLEAKGPHPVCIPAGGELLWKWFMALHKTRQAGMAGPQPISYAEIAAYSRIMLQPIEPRHVAILITMDQTYLDCVYTKHAAVPEGVKSAPPVSSAPISAASFDAMFGGA